MFANYHEQGPVEQIISTSGRVYVLIFAKKNYYLDLLVVIQNVQESIFYSFLSSCSCPPAAPTSIIVVSLQKDKLLVRGGEICSTDADSREGSGIRLIYFDTTSIFHSFILRFKGVLVTFHTNQIQSLKFEIIVVSKDRSLQKISQNSILKRCPPVILLIHQ